MKNILTLLLLLVVTGCSTTRVTMYRDVPAEINVSKYNAVIIDPVTGPYSNKLSSTLNSQLYKSKYFKLMSKDAKANEKNTILKISADITDKDFSQDFQIDEGTCYTNSKKRKCRLYSTFATWSATALFQMTDIQTGEVFQQKRISKRSKAQKQAEGGYIKYDEKDGFKRVMVDIAKKFALAIQPHKERVRVKLFKDDKVPDLEKGIKFAKMSNWSNAVKYFKKAVDFVNSNNIENETASLAYYNYGIALGYSGMDFDEAINNINHAIELYSDKDYFKAVIMIEKFKSDTEKLDKQGYKNAKIGS